MKLKIRLLALSTLLVTLSNLNFSLPTLAANPTSLPKCSKPPTFREEFTNFKPADLADQYAYTILVQRLGTTGFEKLDNPTGNDFFGLRNISHLHKTLEQGVLVANTINNPYTKAESLTLLAAFYRAAINSHRFQYALNLFNNVNTSPNIAQELAEIKKFKKAFETQSANLLQQSFQVAHKIKKQKEKIKALGKIATIYATLEQSEQAYQILTQILKNTHNIEDINQRSSVLHTVVEYYIDPSRVLQLRSQPIMSNLYNLPEKPEQRINRLNTALLIANKIEVNDYKVNLLAKIANEYAKLKQYDRSLQIAQNIQDNSLKGKVLAQIIESSVSDTINQEIRVAQNSRVAESEIQIETNSEILAKVLQVINDIKNVNSQDILLGELACGYINASINIESFIQLDTNKWLRAFADANYLINQAITITNSIRNPHIKSKTLSIIAFKLTQPSVILLVERILDNAETVEAKEQLAKQLRNRALKIAYSIPDSEIKSKTFGVMAFNLFKASREILRHATTFNEKIAKQLYYEGLKNIDQIEDSNIKSETLAEIAMSFITIPWYSESIQNKYHQALKFANSIQVSSVKNKTLKEIAENYINHRGDEKQKNGYPELLSQTLQIANNHSYEIVLRPMIANLYLEVGETDRAFELVNTLKNPEIRLKLLPKVAAQYAIAGESQKSDSIFIEAFQIAETNNNAYQKALLLYEMATAYKNSGRYDKASESITQASFQVKIVTVEHLPLKKINNIYNGIFSIFNSPHETFLLNNQNNQFVIDADVQNMIFQIDRFISVLNMRDKYYPQSYFNHNLQNLIAKSKYEEALELVQQSRSRVLVDLINRPSSLLSYTPEYFEQLKANPTPPPPQIDQIRKIAKEQQPTLVEYAIIYRDNQSQNATKNSESELFIWVVKPTGEVAFRRVNLFNSSLANLVYDTRESMGVRGRGLGLVSQVEKSKQTNRLQQLHQLLIVPIADLLPTDANHNIIFIPTKSLFFVPFTALQDREGKYLIQKHTILTAPSIQVLDLARKRRQKIQQSTNKDVLVVGNPTMPILVSADGKPPEQLSPLPGAEQEARAIASLLNTKPLIGSDATEPVVIARMLKARIIHIATHGLLDPIYQWKKSPGAIALAPLQDNSSIPFNELKFRSIVLNSELLDGFFSFYNSNIPEPPLSAELVVLSACDTGKGQLTEDGVVGLSRSFITAGVPSIIVSLWAIPDAPTAFLMTEFYRNWQQTGDKAQALRQAMLTTMKQHPDPRNWAAFTLIGEAK